MSKLAHSNDETMNKIEHDRRVADGELDLVHGHRLQGALMSMTNQLKQAVNPDTRKGIWLVMDGRARFDTYEASIMECIGHGRRDQVPRKAARKTWKGHDAVLVFCPDIPRPKGTPVGKGEYVGSGEYVEDVDPIK